MKPLLLAGAALMIGASIYGVVDYQHTKNKKEFTTMYTGENNGKAVTNDVAPVENKTNPAAEKNSTVADVKKEETKSASDVTGNSTAKKTKKVTKKKKFRFSEFSRAPIRD